MNSPLWQAFVRPVITLTWRVKIPVFILSLLCHYSWLVMSAVSILTPHWFYQRHCEAAVSILSPPQWFLGFCCNVWGFVCETGWIVWDFFWDQLTVLGLCGTIWLVWCFFLGPVDLFGVSFVGLVDLEQTRAGWDHDQQMASFLSSTNNFSLKQSERKGWFSCSTRRRSFIHTKTFFPPHVLNRVRWWVSRTCFTFVVLCRWPQLDMCFSIFQLSTQLGICSTTIL